MGYNYYNYLAYIDQATDPKLVFKKVQEQLAAKFSTEMERPSTITVKFGDWKMWLHFATDDHVIEEAREMAEWHKMPKLANCPARIEIYAEDDEDEDHYNDHLYVIESLVEPGIYISDPVLGGFPYERTEEVAETADHFLKRLKAISWFEETPSIREEVEKSLSESHNFLQAISHLSFDWEIVDVIDDYDNIITKVLSLAGIETTGMRLAKLDDVTTTIDIEIGERKYHYDIPLEDVGYRGGIGEWINTDFIHDFVNKILLAGEHVPSRLYILPCEEDIVYYYFLTGDMYARAYDEGVITYDESHDDAGLNDEQDPDDESYQEWSDKAIQAIIDGDNDQAIVCFEKSIEALPDYWGGYANLGYYLLQFGEADRSYEFTKKAISLGNIPNSYLNKGHYHLIKGDRDLAVYSYVVSRWGFDTETRFWQDFDSDYEVLPLYGISEELYADIREEVKGKIKTHTMGISDDSGFLALVDASTYETFISADWTLDQIMEHFTKAMNQQDMIMWQSNNDGGGYWRIELLEKPSGREAFRQFERTIRVTNGKLYLTNYDNLTMAAQFKKYKIPGEGGEHLFVKFQNGLYSVTVRQLFNLDEINFNKNGDFDFEIIIVPANHKSGSIEEVIWSTL